MDVLEELPGSNDHNLIIKGKRTKRLRPPSPFGRTVTSSSSSGGDGGCGKESSCIKAKRCDAHSLEDEDMANCLILLAQGSCTKQEESNDIKVENCTTNMKNDLYLYECKTCNKSFSSFQALGGHRASHKKPKVIVDDQNSIFTTSHDETQEFGHENLDVHLATNILDGSDHKTKIQGFLQFSRPDILAKANPTIRDSRIATKIHECGICGSEFPSGQALGGHMRRHRNSTITKVTINAEIQVDVKKPRHFFPLDLNLPAPEDDHRDLKFQFDQGNQKHLVFSAPALVDCHY